MSGRNQRLSFPISDHFQSTVLKSIHAILLYFLEFPRPVFLQQFKPSHWVLWNVYGPCYCMALSFGLHGCWCLTWVYAGLLDTHFHLSKAALVTWKMKTRLWLSFSWLYQKKKKNSLSRSQPLTMCCPTSCYHRSSSSFAFYFFLASFFIPQGG